MDPYGYYRSNFGTGAMSDYELQQAEQAMNVPYSNTASMSDYQQRQMEQGLSMRYGNRMMPMMSATMADPSMMGGNPMQKFASQEAGFVPMFAQGLRSQYSQMAEGARSAAQGIGNFARQVPTELKREYGSSPDEALERIYEGNAGMKKPDDGLLLSRAVKYLRDMDMRRTEELERDTALARLQELLDQSRNYRAQNSSGAVGGMDYDEAEARQKRNLREGKGDRILAKELPELQESKRDLDSRRMR